MASESNRRMLRWAWVGVAAYGAVMVALIVLKAFYRIGYLWDPANQRTRGLELSPLVEFRRAASWFGPVFDAAGNLALFVPFGVLVVVILRLSTGVRRPVLVAAGIGMAASVAVEVAQYVFALGLSDINDVLFNTAGALLGAALARACGPRLYPLWIGLALAAGVVFAVLVGLGERLGDPSEVVDVVDVY